MGIAAVERKVRTPEEQATYEAALAKQEAGIADAYQFSNDSEENQPSKLQQALALKAKEKARQGIVFNKEQIDAIQRSVLLEIESENQNPDSTIEFVKTNEGIRLPSIPLFTLPFDKNWKSAQIWQPDNRQDGKGLLAKLQNIGDNSIHITLRDVFELYPQSQLKLSGVLSKFDERMAYRKDEDVYLHYEAQINTSDYLTHLSGMIFSGEVIDLTPHSLANSTS